MAENHLERHPLLDHTRALLTGRSKELTLKIIAKDTGIGLAWLNDFVTYGDKRDASADRILKLYEYLSKTTIKPV